MKKISFDYDGTLGDHFMGGPNFQKDKIQKLFLELIGSEDFDVYIITRRFGPEMSNDGLKNEHLTVYNMIDELNIEFPKEKILFTNRKYKYSFINQLEIDIHLDDDLKEHDLIKNFSKGSSVDVQKPNWREIFDELLKK